MSASTDSPPVAPANAEQLRAWDGDEGAYWADHAERFDRGVAAYHGLFLEDAAIADTDHVLDIGSGTGQTTRDAARLARSGMALGVDLSSRMIAYARQRAAAEQVHNARFEQADAFVYALVGLVFLVAALGMLGYTVVSFPTNLAHDGFPLAIISLINDERSICRS